MKEIKVRVCNFFEIVHDDNHFRTVSELLARNESIEDLLLVDL